MKNTKIKSLLAFFLLFLLSLNLLQSSPFDNFFKREQTLIILDSNSSKPLPYRYRDLTSLNVSASSQFNPLQLEPLKKAINKPNICIVDLRQEPHGNINDLAISFYDQYKVLNNGFSSIEVQEKENEYLNRIKPNSTIDIYYKTGRIWNTVTVNTISDEETLVKNAGMDYKRFSVMNGSIPSPSTVDDFVDFIKNKPSDLHIHFHCLAGEGRSTLFMSMYQIMMNTTNLTLEQILFYQYNLGGILLTHDSDRVDFLNEFYNYINLNKESNYQKPYSEWIKINNL